MITPDLEFIRQQHESFLNDLEGLAVQALASGNWTDVYAHIHQMSAAKLTLGDCFESQEDYQEALAFINRLLCGEASTKDLTRPGADLFPTERNER